MTTAVTNAIQAYDRASRQIASEMSENRRAQGGAEPLSSFADLVKSGYQATKQAGLHAEAQSIQAIAGEANLAEVVQAVSKAEVTLQTMVSVRDRVVQAYQEVIRMPL